MAMTPSSELTNQQTNQPADKYGPLTKSIDVDESYKGCCYLFAYAEMVD